MRPSSGCTVFPVLAFPDLGFESTRTLTPAEFVDWIARRPPSDANRYELLHGRVVMTPPAGHPHGIVEALAVVLGSFIRDLELGAYFGSSQGFALPSGDTVAPDHSFVSVERWAAMEAPRDGEFLRVAPDLVVEILSPSTAVRDRGEKHAIYEANGVREYWLVDPRRREILVFERRDGRFAEPRTYSEDTLAVSAVLAGMKIDVAGLFAVTSR